MPNYPTDYETFSNNGAGIARGVTSMDNVAEFREVKVQTVSALTNADDTLTTTTAHGMATGTEVKFIDGTVGEATIVKGTTYYAIYNAATKFKIATTEANAIAGTAINLGVAETVHYYTPDGELTKLELSGVTNTINMFADASNDTIPATSTFAGFSMMAQIGNQITSLYDALDCKRLATAAKTYDTPALAALVSGATRIAHGFTSGTPISVTATAGGLTAGTTYYVVPIKGVGANAGDTITLNSHAIADDSPITITKVSAPCGLTVGTTYYSTGAAANTFTLLDAVGGVAVPLTDNADVYFTTDKAFAVGTTSTGEPINLSADADTKIYKVANVLTDAELSYIANMDSIQFNDLLKQAERFGYRLKKLVAQIENVNTTGTLGTSKYPSGQNNGYN